MLCCVYTGIIERVKFGGSDTGDGVFRPSADGLSATGPTNEQMLNCLALVMEESWAETHQTRPTFDECLDLIYRLSGDKYVSVLS